MSWRLTGVVNLLLFSVSESSGHLGKSILLTKGIRVSCYSVYRTSLFGVGVAMPSHVSLIHQIGAYVCDSYLMLALVTLGSTDRI